jgi:hypothetical protein
MIFTAHEEMRCILYNSFFQPVDHFWLDNWYWIKATGRLTDILNEVK